MTTQTYEDWTQWHAANNGAKTNRWFVCKGHPATSYHKNTKGQLVRYASFEAANKSAATLNQVSP